MTRIEFPDSAFMHITTSRKNKLKDRKWNGEPENYAQIHSHTAEPSEFIVIILLCLLILASLLLLLILRVGD